MDSNWCSAEGSTRPSENPPGSPPDDLAVLEADVDNLARDLSGLPEAVRAQRVLRLRRLVDRLEGHWLSELAGVDACGAAGADQGVQAPPPPAGCVTGST